MLRLGLEFFFHPLPYLTSSHLISSHLVLSHSLYFTTRTRSDGDDGAFRRAPRRDEEGYEPSRSENDSSWRRGGLGVRSSWPRSGSFNGLPRPDVARKLPFKKPFQRRGDVLFRWGGRGSDLLFRRPSPAQCNWAPARGFALCWERREEASEFQRVGGGDTTGAAA